MRYQDINGTSTAATQKSTGKHWDEWIVILDNAKMQAVPHKEIAQWLWDHYGDEKGSIERVLSGWWCQQVTVGYEYAHGRRVKGETADAGFQVGVQKTLPATAEKLWDYIVGEGLTVWLGDLNEFELQKGFIYQTVQGATGEIRSVDPYKKIRLTYEAANRPKSTLQLTLLPAGVNKTSLNFHHEKLQNADDRQAMKDHWQSVLTQIEKKLLH